MQAQNSPSRRHAPRHRAESFPRGFGYWLGGLETYTRNFLVVLPSAYAFGVGVFTSINIFS